MEKNQWVWQTGKVGCHLHNNENEHHVSSKCNQEEVYKWKEAGPKQNPGEPQWGLKRFNWIHWVRPERYDLNQDRGVPVIPIETNLSRSISCETVSKAAVKSRRTSLVKSPESAANSRSLVILTRAVSVLWWGRKPDWNSSYKLLLERCSWI